MMNTNWKQKILEEMKRHEESFDDVISCTLTEEELLEQFDEDYGSAEGKPFTLWTEKRVYFPCCYDGSEWVDSVSREPNGEVTMHIGGGG